MDDIFAWLGWLLKNLLLCRVPEEIKKERTFFKHHNYIFMCLSNNNDDNDGTKRKGEVCWNMAVT